MKIEAGSNKIPDIKEGKTSNHIMLIKIHKMVVDNTVDTSLNLTVIFIVIIEPYGNQPGQFQQGGYNPQNRYPNYPPQQGGQIPPSNYPPMGQQPMQNQPYQGYSNPQQPQMYYAQGQGGNTQQRD